MTPADSGMPRASANVRRSGQARRSKIRMWRKRRYRTSIVARAAITASFTMSVVSRICSADRNFSPGIYLHDLTDAVRLEQMPVIRPFIIGFATTLKHLFKKPITVNYPEQKVPMFPKFRGKQVLMRDENGLEKCVACGLCSVACPADAIYLEAAENDGSVQAGPR